MADVCSLNNNQMMEQMDALEHKKESPMSFDNARSPYLALNFRGSCLREDEEGTKEEFA
jgi:hypothetical protein